ncbi:hypothetical protein VitviT2T_030450 [Vitis vinifera]|uniref:Reverse transcriptase Ty1/copia-type domain-containing protein n=1 Tax=Vitis vinifera TaxID=29760 RepID=A0ABY9DZD4_VITVI|nr:hypothetical protein VitviT2T_030450 [Vitis vinifera]
MDEELEALHKNKTWVLVPRTLDMHVNGSKWVFKPKLKPDGSLDHLKACVVAKGYHQVDGLDYTETFSPVIKLGTIRMVITIALVKKWPIRQLDVKNAFLHGLISKDIHMEQPPRMADLKHPSHVCKLQKALYALKQAPRAWFDRFNDFLLKNGFFCSLANPSLFIFHSNLGTLILLLYVDDILLTGSFTALVSTFIQLFSSKFAMKDLGQIHHFLGIERRFRCSPGSETFSPVIKLGTIRMVITIALVKKWPIHQLDVKNAFLHGLISKYIHMEQSPGMANLEHPSHVCKLQKALYGLKQAPRA